MVSWRIFAGRADASAGGAALTPNIKFISQESGFMAAGGFMSDQPEFTSQLFHAWQ